MFEKFPSALNDSNTTYSFRDEGSMREASDKVQVPRKAHLVPAEVDELQGRDGADLRGGARARQ